MKRLNFKTQFKIEFLLPFEKQSVVEKCLDKSLYPCIFTCWWRSLLVTTPKFGLLIIRQHSVTTKLLSLYPQGDRSGMRKPKRININTNHSYHQSAGVYLPKPIPTDLTIKSDSIFTNPIENDGVQGWSM